MQVAMDDLLDMLDEHSDLHTPYFHQRTGDVAIYFEDTGIDPDPVVDPDDPDWIPVPRVQSHDAFRVMEHFVDTLDEPDVQQQLRRALQGKGAFRRFRDTLHGFPDLLGRWNQFQRDDLLQRALQFLAELDIEPIYELRPLPAPSTPTQAPAQTKQPSIRLHHVLLLGAPDGKTERIEGRVLRRVRLRSPQQARKQFERLAREIMEQQGLGFRRSAVEGLDTFDLAPFRLALEGDTVWLSTEVSRELWDALS